jgi:hypothetical protein
MASKRPLSRAAGAQCGSGYGVTVCPELGVIVTSNPFMGTLTVFRIVPPATGSGAAGPGQDTGGRSPAACAFPLLHTFGGPGKGPLEFARPGYMCAMTREGRTSVLVAEWGNNRAQEVDVLGA